MEKRNSGKKLTIIQQVDKDIQKTKEDVDKIVKEILTIQSKMRFLL